MVFAETVFFGSLIGTAILFYLKHLEMARDRALVPMREKADEYALDLKAILAHSRFQMSKIPPLAVLLTRFAVREIALRFAALMRLGEQQAHRLADLVSYKHRFERRETKSEFLKQVSEFKNGEGKREAAASSEHDESAR